MKIEVSREVFVPKTKLLYTLCSNMQPPERENSGCFASRRGEKPHTQKNSALDSCPRPTKYSRPNHERKNKLFVPAVLYRGRCPQVASHPELATIDALKTRLLLRRSRTFWKTSRQASSRTSRLSWLTLSPKVWALALSISVVAAVRGPASSPTAMGGECENGGGQGGASGQ